MSRRSSYPGQPRHTKNTTSQLNNGFGCFMKYEERSHLYFSTPRGSQNLPSTIGARAFSSSLKKSIERATKFQSEMRRYKKSWIQSFSLKRSRNSRTDFQLSPVISETSISSSRSISANLNSCSLFIFPYDSSTTKVTSDAELAPM